MVLKRHLKWCPQKTTAFYSKCSESRRCVKSLNFQIENVPFLYEKSVVMPDPRYQSYEKVIEKNFHFEHHRLRAGTRWQDRQQPDIRHFDLLLQVRGQNGFALYITCYNHVIGAVNPDILVTSSKNLFFSQSRISMHFCQ